jgi:hypothetical protein
MGTSNPRKCLKIDRQRRRRCLSPTLACMVHMHTTPLAIQTPYFQPLKKQSIVPPLSKTGLDLSSILHYKENAKACRIHADTFRVFAPPGSSTATTAEVLCHPAPHCNTSHTGDRLITPCSSPTFLASIPPTPLVLPSSLKVKSL